MGSRKQEKKTEQPEVIVQQETLPSPSETSPEAKTGFQKVLSFIGRGLFSEAREKLKEMQKNFGQSSEWQYYEGLCEKLKDDSPTMRELHRIRLDVFKEYSVDCDCDLFQENTDNIDQYAIDITRLVLNDRKHFTEKIKNMCQSVCHPGATIGLLFRVQKEGIKISFVCKRSDSILKCMCDNFIGQFPGTSFSEVETNEIRLPQGGYVGILSLLPSYAIEDAVTQGIDAVFNGIRPVRDSEKYNVLVLAKAVTKEEILQRRDALCSDISTLFPYAKKTISGNESQEQSTTNGFSIDANLNQFNIGKLAFGLSGGYNRSKTYGSSYSRGENIELVNYGIQHAVELLQKQVTRFDNGISYGMWQTGIYVTSQDLDITEEVLGSISSIMAGKESYVEVPFKAVFDASDEQKKNRDAILASINSLNHPETPNRHIFSHLTSMELAQVMTVPQQSVPGFMVTYGVPFGRDVVDYGSGKSNEAAGDLNIGTFQYIHNDDGKKRKVYISRDALTMHSFVTGSTGKGKSNTIYQLLSKITEKPNSEGSDIRFMVIEPAKGEYRRVFGSQAAVYCANPDRGTLLTMNPFEFPDKININDHIDRILEIFNACWPMYAAMPAVLKDAIIHAYKECGWNMNTSRYHYEDTTHKYPTFSEVCAWIDIVIDSSSYDKENKGAYKGALKTRLKSLTNGINGKIFCKSKCLSGEDLFENNTIIDLSTIGSTETKSLIMGMLVIKMQEFYQTSDYMNSPLRHVTVLEEAHHLLKRTMHSSVEGGNMVGKSVEMLANAIAEMRTYGEAFIIVDQSPALMDMSVIRNTNTKIVLGLPDQEDRTLVGKAMGLSDEQIMEIAKLEKGVAVVFQNNWAKAVLCKFERYETQNDSSNDVTTEPAKSEPDSLATCLLNPELFRERYASLETLQPILEEYNLSRDAQEAIGELFHHSKEGKLPGKLTREEESDLLQTVLKTVYLEFFDDVILKQKLNRLLDKSQTVIEHTIKEYLIHMYSVDAKRLTLNNKWFAYLTMYYFHYIHSELSLKQVVPETKREKTNPVEKP